MWGNSLFSLDSLTGHGRKAIMLRFIFCAFESADVPLWRENPANRSKATEKKAAVEASVGNQGAIALRCVQAGRAGGELVRRSRCGDLAAAARPHRKRSGGWRVEGALERLGRARRQRPA